MAPGGEAVADSGERQAWIALAATDGVGPAAFARLLDAFGTARAVLGVATSRDGERTLVDAGRDGASRSVVRPETATAIVATAREPDAVPAACRRAGIRILVPHDADYPHRLRAIELPPAVLFARGDPDALERRPAIALVGTRRPTEPGRRLAARLVGGVAQRGAGIVSGLALGIDGAAHEAAIWAQVPTVAVLGGGHDRLYPASHRSLADWLVAAGGAVLSEHPPATRPTRGTFPRRNRLISGLADATIVVEAGRGSGALTTAAWALEQGRPLFVAPGPVDAPQSSGCLAFLREFPGEARIVAGVAELVEDLELVGVLPGSEPPSRRDAGRDRGRGLDRRADLAGLAPATRVRRRLPQVPGVDPQLAALGEAERPVARSLLDGHTTVDELVAATGLAPATVLGALTMLELEGLVVAAFGRYRVAGPLALVGPRTARPSGSTRGRARVEIGRP